MSSSRINDFVSRSSTVGSVLEIVLAAATAALMVMVLASSLQTTGAVHHPAATYVTLPAVLVVGRSDGGTATVAGLEALKAAPNQVNLAQ